MLRVEGVSVFYGRVQAVRQASLEVRPGEIVTLLGPNGAGKSSLLKAIVGQVQPQGSVRWQDVCLSGLPTHRIVRQGVALVPEGRQLLHTLSVRDNLILGAYSQHSRSFGRLLGPAQALLGDAGCGESLRQVMALFPQLADRLPQIASSLSGGEQQMLAVGRALMSRPRLLLLDEPSIGLAPNLVREILDLLPRLREEGLTILLVEQDARAALRVADRGYVMETGRIVAEGTSRELLSSARLQRAYLGMA